MQRLIMSMALLAAIGCPAAIAQSGTGGTSTAVKSQPQPSRDAPVGHRQPRAGALPSEKNLTDANDPLARENAALDKKIKSICRGC